MKALGITPPGKKWLAVVKVVDAVVVCTGIGNAITAARGSDPYNSATVTPASSPRRDTSTLCNVVPSGLDYMAATILCPVRLARRRGDEPAVTDFTFKISEGSSWQIAGDPFRRCPHDRGSSSPDSGSGSDSCWKRTDLIQQLRVRSIASPVRKKPFYLGSRNKLLVARPTATAGIPLTRAVVFGDLAS